MRIGILTLPLNQNYGGILQAYALQTVLERLGLLTVLIDLMILFRSLWRDHRVGRTVNQCHRTGILLSYLINRQLLRGPQIKATNFKAITNIQIGRNMLWIIGRTLQNTLLRIGL